MIPTYRRFRELTEKARKYLNCNGSEEECLAKAVSEIAYLNKNDVPGYQWGDVQSILERCRTHKATGDEGVFRASINNMNHGEKESLKRDIQLL